MVEFRIAAPIHESFPGLFVNLIVVRGLDNLVGDPVRRQVDAFARAAEDELRRRCPAKSDLPLDPRVSTYFDMFRTFGSNPKRVKPSHFALADRVVRGGTLPDINPAVNLYNAFSLRYLVPFGGEDLDRVDEYFELTYATGTEPWRPIGSEAAESTRAGDVVWRDRCEVSTTSLNHRQCEKTKLVAATRNAYFISEGVRGVNDAHIETMSADFVQVFGELLGGEYRRFTLDAEHPAVRV